jgi:hypothetical protein
VEDLGGGPAQNTACGSAWGRTMLASQSSAAFRWEWGHSSPCWPHSCEITIFAKVKIKENYKTESNEDRSWEKKSYSTLCLSLHILFLKKLHYYKSKHYDI